MTYSDCQISLHWDYMLNVCYLAVSLIFLVIILVLTAPYWLFVRYSYCLFPILLVSMLFPSKLIMLIGNFSWTQSMKILNTATLSTHNYKKLVLKKFEWVEHNFNHNFYGTGAHPSEGSRGPGPLPFFDTVEIVPSNS